MFASYSKWPATRHRDWVHPLLFRVPSSIAGAGTGVFASGPISAGAHLGYYCGRVHWTYPVRNGRNFYYILEISRRPPWIGRSAWALRRNSGGAYVDGVGDMAMINCCKREIK